MFAMSNVSREKKMLQLNNFTMHLYSGHVVTLMALSILMVVVVG